MSKVNNRRLNSSRNNMNDGGRVLRASFTGEKTAAFERLFFFNFFIWNNLSDSRLDSFGDTSYYI
jgi:hypothetical protein